MPGRRKFQGTDAHRAAIRRQQVRQNVQAFRQRNRERKPSESDKESSAFSSNYRFSKTSSNGSEPYRESLSLRTSSLQIDVTVKAVDDGTVFSLKLPFKICVESTSLEVLACPSSTGATDDIFFSTLILRSGSDSHTYAPPDSSPHLIQLEPEQFRLTHVEIECGGLKTQVDFITSNESCVLEEALIGLALNMLGRERSDQQLLVYAMYIEYHSLSLLIIGLKNFSQGVYPEIFKYFISTAMTMAVSELLVKNCEERLQIHLKGVNAMKQHTDSMTLSAREILQDYGEVQLPLHIIDRKLDMLSEQARNDPNETSESEHFNTKL